VVRAIAMLAVAMLAAACEHEPATKRQREPNPPSIGFLDTPAAESSVGPVFMVAGWAADESGVDRVRIYLDDEPVATVPVTIARPDVDRAYPKYASTGPVHGFGTAIDAGSRAGYCTVRLEVLDKRGGLTQVAHANVKIEP